MNATDCFKLASIAVDLDGTLAVHKPGKKFDPDHIGAPVPPMLARVKRWISEGKEVKIFTARASDPKNIPRVRKWLKEHGISGCEVTHQKTPDIERIYDDRAVKVYKNEGTLKSASTYFDVARALDRKISGWSEQWSARSLVILPGNHRQATLGEVQDSLHPVRLESVSQFGIMQ